MKNFKNIDTYLDYWSYRLRMANTEKDVEKCLDKLDYYYTLLKNEYNETIQKEVQKEIQR